LLFEVNEYGDILRQTTLQGDFHDQDRVRGTYVVFVPDRVTPAVTLRRFERIKYYRLSNYIPSGFRVYYNLFRPFYRQNGVNIDASNGDTLQNVGVQLVELSRSCLESELFDYIVVDQPGIKRVSLFYMWEKKLFDEASYDFPVDPLIAYKLFLLRPPERPRERLLNNELRRFGLFAMDLPVDSYQLVLFGDPTQPTLSFNNREFVTYYIFKHVTGDYPLITSEEYRLIEPDRRMAANRFA
jgi:hypothetical protein